MAGVLRGRPTVGPGLSATDFTTGKTAGGLNQTYCKGWPLYYFAALANGQNVREQAGDTGGNGVGGVWYVARPDYAVLVAMGAVVNKTSNQAAFKRYLVDPQGRAPYTFGVDARLPATQPTNCTDGCAAVWPVLYQANAAVPLGLQASDFSTLTRPDGPNGGTRLQTTCKGNPLYYYAADHDVRGKVEGDGTAGQCLVAIP